jgi:hypothetical protein
MATFEKRLTRQEEKCQIEASKLSRQLFGCEQDAAKALEKFGKGKRHFEIIGDVNAVTNYAEKGRPRAGAEKIIIGYNINVTVARDTDAITQESYKKGRFILATNEETLPNQKGKAISNPTLRWVFQLMEGISIVNLQGEGDSGGSRRIIANINDVRRKIIYLFGPSACEIYGLEISEEIAHPLRM